MNSFTEEMNQSLSCGSPLLAPGAKQTFPEEENERVCDADGQQSAGDVPRVVACPVKVVVDDTDQCGGNDSGKCEHRRDDPKGPQIRPPPLLGR